MFNFFFVCVVVQIFLWMCSLFHGFFFIFFIFYFVQNSFGIVTEDYSLFLMCQKVNNEYMK